MSLQRVIKEICAYIKTSEKTANLIVEKAVLGGETTVDHAIEWYEQRFKPNCVFIDEKEYAQMCIDALRILSTTAATDFGGSRQRDLGQLWADMTRGYLGEYAFKKFLEEKWNIESELGHEQGELKDYLPMDIHKVRKENESEFRPPRIGIGVKTVKWNGIWFDIPGDQFRHSDIHVLVKVGTGRDHLFAFFKQISVFKDKVLKRGQDIGCLTPAEAQEMFDKLPSFEPVVAYICGFIRKNESYKNMSCEGRKGPKHYLITAWNGPIRPGDIDIIKDYEKVKGSVKFAGIGKFTHDNGYLFNTGKLLWKQSDWQTVCDAL